MPLQFASRLDNVETSAIRELFKLLGKPGIISFAGGFPDSAMFDVEGLREASQKALAEEPGGALQYGATEGYEPLRTQLAAFMKSKGVSDSSRTNLIVTTGSQQALDLLGKTMISPGDKVIVEGPTFLATIQCFRLYGADLVSAPIDANGVQVDKLEKADRRAQAQVRLPDPHLRQPERRAAVAGAPQEGAGAGREVPGAGRRGRPVRRPVLRRGAAAVDAGAHPRTCPAAASGSRTAAA
jgi:DNA-binding transcriptional MocR family regulator